MCVWHKRLRDDETYCVPRNKRHDARDDLGDTREHGHHGVDHIGRLDSAGVDTHQRDEEDTCEPLASMLYHACMHMIIFTSRERQEPQRRRVGKRPVNLRERDLGSIIDVSARSPCPLQPVRAGIIAPGLDLVGMIVGMVSHGVQRMALNVCKVLI